MLPQVGSFRIAPGAEEGERRLGDDREGDDEGALDDQRRKAVGEDITRRIGGPVIPIERADSTYGCCLVTSVVARTKRATTVGV